MKEFYKHEVPTVEEAKLLLREAENVFPGQWVQHSFYTAEATKIISENCEELNSDCFMILEEEME